MRLISFLLFFALSFNVLAEPIHELERSLDDYHYAVSVEWDQEDKEFYERKTNEFIESFSRIIKAGGMSNADVIALVEKKAVSKKTVEAIKLKFSTLTNISDAEIVDILKETSQDLYQSGANWNSSGVIIGGVAIGVGVTLLLGWAIWFGVTHECVAYDYRRKTDCDSFNCYERYCSEYVRR